MAQSSWIGDPPASVSDLGRLLAGHSGDLDEPHVATVEDVLRVLRPDLGGSGWTVSKGRRSTAGVPLPVPGGAPLLADAWHPVDRAALWLETGRGWSNFGFLEHVVEATCAPEIHHVAVALRHKYKGTRAFAPAEAFLDRVFGCGGIGVPYWSLTLLGF